VQLYPPLGLRDLHVAPFLHGDDKHAFNFAIVVVVILALINFYFKFSLHNK